MGVTEVQLYREEFTTSYSSSMANVDEYLAHIGYTGSKEPTVANLADLHSCHLLAVVFENISCMIGEKIKLDPDWIFEKIVKRGRGGFCFELNGIFHWLLKSLGYNVRMVSAAVASPTPTGFSFPTDHLVNLVKIEDCQFLCDVGFGKHTFTTPIPLEVGVHTSSHGLHQVVGEKGGAVDLQKWEAGQWSTKNRIDLVTQRVFSDFETQCKYHQTEPTAYMAGNSITARYLPGGELITMLGFSFRHYRLGESGEQELVDSKDDLPSNEVNQLLRERFLLSLKDDIVPRRFDMSQFNV